MANVRKRYSAEEKAKIVLEILKGELTQQQITAKYGVHSTQLHNWKKQAIEGIVAGFSGKKERQTQDQNQLVDELYQQIGKLKVELDWLKKKSDLFR
ncbi:MAG: transposase [Gammaproteobacteria bacterium]